MGQAPLNTPDSSQTGLPRSVDPSKDDRIRSLRTILYSYLRTRFVFTRIVIFQRTFLPIANIQACAKPAISPKAMLHSRVFDYIVNTVAHMQLSAPLRMEKGAFCLCAMGRLSGRFLKAGALWGCCASDAFPLFHILEPPSPRIRLIFRSAIG